MKYADLSRYSDKELHRMLDSYRELASTHMKAGHYALAKWASGMCTHITIVLNHRWEMAEHERRAQMTLDELTVDSD